MFARVLLLARLSVLIAAARFVPSVAEAQPAARAFHLDGNVLLVPAPITFVTGGVALTPESDSALAHVAAYLTEKSYISLMRIEVHLEGGGDAGRAQSLSQFRAYAIAKALVNRGVACNRLLPAGFGATKPIAPNDTPENRATNRRVTFVNAALRGRPIGGMPTDGGGVSGGDPCSLPPFLPGVWSRDFIKRRGVEGEKLAVRYLQTPAPFGDVRIPLHPKWRASATSFDVLTDAELRALARQKGFTGVTTVDGAVITWHHEIDYQPDTSRDASNVAREDADHMVETGLDGSFVERYSRLSAGDTAFLALRIERAGRLDRVLIVVGDWFYHARNRATDLPPAESLEALIAATHPTRAQLVAWLDCELSAGRVRGGSVPWEIQHSTLPWRVGRHLEFVDRISADTAAGTLVPRAAPGEFWKVTHNSLARRDLAALFPAAP